MVYDNKSTIYSDTDSTNSREIKIIQDAIIGLEDEIGVIKEDVENLATEVSTVDINGVNGHFTSLESEALNVSGTATINTVNSESADIETLNADSATIGSAEVSGDLKVDGLIDGTLKNYNISTLNVPTKLTAGEVEVSGDLSSDNLVVSTSGTIPTLDSTTGNFTDITVSNSATVKNLTIGQNSITTGGINKLVGITTLNRVDADEINVDEINADKAEIELAELDKIKNSVTIRDENKFIEIPTHSTADDFFIKVKPFNGTYKLKLDKYEDDILSINIVETTTNNGTVSAKVQWSSDERVYLKEVYLFEDGSLVFRTFGDGYLFYAGNVVDKNFLAPETYYATLPEGTVLFKKSILDVCGTLDINSLDNGGEEPKEDNTVDEFYQLIKAERGAVTKENIILPVSLPDATSSIFGIAKADLDKVSLTKFVTFSQDTSSYSNWSVTNLLFDSVNAKGYKMRLHLPMLADNSSDTYLKVLANELKTWSNEKIYSWDNPTALYVGEGLPEKTVSQKKTSMGLYKTSDVELETNDSILDEYMDSPYGTGLLALKEDVSLSQTEFVEKLFGAIRLFNEGKTDEAYALADQYFRIHVVGRASGEAMGEEPNYIYFDEYVGLGNPMFIEREGATLSTSYLFPFVLNFKFDNLNFYKYEYISPNGLETVTLQHKCEKTQPNRYEWIKWVQE